VTLAIVAAVLLLVALATRSVETGIMAAWMLRSRVS